MRSWTKKLFGRFVLWYLRKFCPQLLHSEEHGWHCAQSFTGKCIQIDQHYDEICIFCGSPDERK